MLHQLVDVVSKGGNLLLNVGPMPGGAIPPAQVARLEAIGAWLAVNGEAIYGTKPWVRAVGQTAGGVPLRFTQSAGGDTVYAIALGAVTGTVTITGFDEPATAVRLVGGGSLAFAATADGLGVTLPPGLPPQAATAIAITLATP
jgi:alpha-L-fucosidase